MPLRLFSEQTSWEQARRELRFTRARLLADETHAKHAKPLSDLLVQWNTIDQERRDADDQVVDANASVEAVNEKLDTQVGGLATQLRYDLDQPGTRADDHPTFKAFFSITPSASSW